MSDKMSDKESKDEYVAFGDVWKRQMMEMRKEDIVEMFKQQCLKRQELEAYIELRPLPASHFRAPESKMPNENETIQQSRTMEGEYKLDIHDANKFRLGFVSCANWFRHRAVGKE